MRKTKRFISIFCILILLVTLFVPSASSFAANEKKKVKVGFMRDMESMMSMNEKNGIKTGYGYEYLQMVANYTNWEYEYVFGEWYDLWGYLADGTIDLLVDVSYTKERAETILFPDHPMGEENYCLYSYPSHKAFSASDLKASLDGCRLGVTQNTLQEQILREKVKELGSTCEIITFLTDDSRNQSFEEGKLDYIIDAETSALEGWIELCQMGEPSPIYLAVTPERQDILSDLNNALSELERVNPTYISELYNKYYSRNLISAQLSEKEGEWLSNHNTLRIGYIPSEAINEKEETCEMLTELCNECFRKLNIDGMNIEIAEYGTYQEMIRDLADYQIDLVYPMFADPYEAELADVALITEIDSMSISLVTQKQYTGTEIKSVAICAGAMVTNYVKEYYSKEISIYEYTEITSCLDSVAEGRAEMAVVSASGLEEALNSSPAFGNLIARESDDTLYRSIGCRRGNTGLYMLMCRGVNLFDKSYIRTLVNKYNSVETDFSIRAFVLRNIYKLLATLILLVVIIVSLILFVGRRKARRLRSISELDHLTGVLNRSGEARIKKLIENGEEGLFILFDVDHFKSFNDTYGHDGGDEVLKALANTLKAEFKEKDIIIRLGGDEFAVYVTGLVDYIEACEKLSSLIRKVDEIRLEKVNKETVSISIGATFWMKKNLLPFNSLYKNADDGCYESKKTEGSAFTFV